VQQQQRQQSALPTRADREIEIAIANDLERAKQAKVHGKPTLTQITTPVAAFISQVRSLRSFPPCRPEGTTVG
jgi:hypothetical protein